MQRPFAFRAMNCFGACVLSISCISLAAQGIARPAATPEQITTVRVGAVSIALPPLTGDLAEPGPDYRVLFEPLAPITNRLVAAFVPKNKLETIHSGSVPQMDEYALVEIARRAEFTEIDSSTFQQIAEALGKQFGGDLSEFQKGSQDEINHNLKGLGSSATLTIDKPTQLGIMFAKVNEIGVGMITPYTVNGVTTRMAGCLALLRVRGRVLSVYTYATYKDEGSVTWVKTTTEQWADAVLKANQ